MKAAIYVRLLRKVSRAITLLVALGSSSFAFGDDVKFKAGFVPEKSEFTLGEPIYLAFNLTNTGSKAITMRVITHQWDSPMFFKIQAFDASGTKVQDEFGDRGVGGSFVVGMTEIKPGSVYVDRYYLPTFIKFKKPGEYIVVASRSLEFVNLTENYNLMHSGSFGSPDGLNHVDEFTSSTPGGSYIFNYGSTNSYFQITNRFKLTVLPADKERLLKHANEMLAKLDDIGDRDPVAKTNGPRALDKMDLETEESAWLVGKDNVDLAWAVRVLSDIGDQSIIPELKRHLNDKSMKVRFACVKVLCALGEPLRAEWIVPIIKSRQWSFQDEPEEFVASHGGPDATNILNMCFDPDPSLDGAHPGAWNTRLTNIIKNISTYQNQTK